MLFCVYGQKHPQPTKLTLSACLSLTMWRDCHFSYSSSVALPPEQALEHFKYCSEAVVTHKAWMQARQEHCGHCI